MDIAAAEREHDKAAALEQDAPKDALQVQEQPAAAQEQQLKASAVQDRAAAAVSQGHREAGGHSSKQQGRSGAAFQDQEASEAALQEAENLKAAGEEAEKVRKAQEKLQRKWGRVVNQWHEQTVNYHCSMGELTSAISAKRHELRVISSRSEQQKDAVKKQQTKLQQDRDSVSRSYREGIEKLQKKSAAVLEKILAAGMVYDPQVALTLEEYEGDLDVPDDYTGPRMPRKCITRSPQGRASVGDASMLSSYVCWIAFTMLDMHSMLD